MAKSRELSQQGLAALEREDWASAESSFSRAIKTCPDNSDARRCYAEGLWSRGDRTAALDQIREAIRLSPADSGLHLRLAQMSLELGDEQTAQHETSKALDLDPNLAEGWVMRARLLARRGRLTEALADYHRALRFSPEHREVLYEVAQVHRALDQPRRALTTLQQLVELYPPGSEPPQVMALMGLSHLSLGQPQQAAETLRLAAELGEETPELLCQLAEAELRAGQTLAADEAVRRALAIDPDHAASRAVLERIEVAATAAQGTLRR